MTPPRISQSGNRVCMAVPLSASGVHGRGERCHAAVAPRAIVDAVKLKLYVGCGKSGLRHAAHHRSGELSGGEQQRVALARALITSQAVLADEPTGDLDGRTAEAVFELIARLHRDHQLTSLIATHNLAVRAPLPPCLKIAAWTHGGNRAGVVPGMNDRFCMRLRGVTRARIANTMCSGRAGLSGRRRAKARECLRQRDQR